MPLHSYLISASALLCERILNEKDEVLSAIRIVDIFNVPEVPAEAPTGSLPLVQAYCLVIIKTQSGYHGQHLIQIKLLNMKGELSNLGEAANTDVAARPGMGDDVPGGATIAFQLNIAVKNYGTCYVCVYLDGEEIARAPFTLQRQSLKTNG
jgi:hypothetical protein